MATPDTPGQVIAAGTQDLAALAGLFCTNSVENNVLATQYGFGAVCISALSMLGLLGLVKTTIKISLGLERCEMAGFNLDSLRGIFGYGLTEISPTDDHKRCATIYVSFLEDNIIIMKKEYFLDRRITPMIKVGADWSEGLRGKTTINIGNLEAETSISQGLWMTILFSTFCSGITAWLLLVIRSPWNWAKFLAILGLHICLEIMVIIPLWYQRQTGRPGKYLTPEKWDMLLGKDYKIGELTLLQAQVNMGDVCHLQGRTSLIHTPWFRAVSLLVATLTIVGYICQYTIVKSASNLEAIIWISCQAAAALFRVMYWMIDPSFDDPKTDDAECVMLNSTQFPEITLIEILCASDQRKFQLKKWVWDYIKSTSITEILRLATSRPVNERVPLTNEDDVQVLLWVNFGRIFEQRGIDKFRHDFRLGFWRLSNSESAVHPFILLYIPVTHLLEMHVSQHVWIESVANSTLENPCSLFVITQDNVRIHLKCDPQPKCHHDGPHDGPHDNYEKSHDSSMFHNDRKNVCAWISNSIAPLDQGHGANTWGTDIWVHRPNVTDEATERLKRSRANPPSIRGFDLAPNRNIMSTGHKETFQEGLDRVGGYIKSRSEQYNLRAKYLKNFEVPNSAEVNVV